MGTANLVDFARREGITGALTDLSPTGAQQLIATAVQAELDRFMARYGTERTEIDHGTVVRNGHHPERPF